MQIIKQYDKMCTITIVAAWLKNQLLSSRSSNLYQTINICQLGENANFMVVLKLRT